MNRYFGWAFASVVSLGLGGLGAASAADMAVKAPVYKAPPPVAVYNWTGCYVGGNIGGKWARTGDVVNIAPTASTAASSLDFGSADSDTFIGGGQIGCNWQSDHLVFGIEGDADAQRWKRSQAAAGVLPALFVPGDTFQLTSTWQASVRGRIGYAWDRNLVYATGGVAFTDVNANTNWIPVGIFPGTITSQTKDLVGATVGGGFEHAFTDNFTAGLEGRYTWYGTQTFNAGLLSTFFTGGAGGVFVFAPTNRSVRVETGEVMLKANWKFTTGPVLAKY